MTEPVPFVVLVWDDAFGDATTEVTLKTVMDGHHAQVFQTAGWLLKDDETGVSLANERGVDQGEEVYRGRTFVPRGMVRSLTPFILTRPRKKRALKV
mgnify:FL=1